MNEMNLWPLVILGAFLFWVVSGISKGWCASRKEVVVRNEPNTPRRNTLVYVDKRQINVFLIVDRGEQGDSRIIDIGGVESIRSPVDAHPLLACPSNN